MSINKYKPHIFVLPEDDANRQIANGFLLEPKLNVRAIQVLPPCGGWAKVLDSFLKDHVSEMSKYPERNIVLLIDFDNSEERFNQVKIKIPETLQDRVFILGVQSKPESLKKNIGRDFEHIGKSLAKDCAYDTNGVWGHDFLKHNSSELERMILNIKPFLFNI